MTSQKRLGIAYVTALVVAIAFLAINLGYKEEKTTYCHGDDPILYIFGEAGSLRPGECIPAIKRSWGWPITDQERWYTPSYDYITKDRTLNANLQFLNYLVLVAISLPAGYLAYLITGRSK